MREKGTEGLFEEVTSENFPNLGKQMDTQVREANRTLHYLNPKTPSPRYVVLKLSKGNDRKRILKAAGVVGRWRGETATTKETPSGFSQIS